MIRRLIPIFKADHRLSTPPRKHAIVSMPSADGETRGFEGKDNDQQGVTSGARATMLRSTIGDKIETKDWISPLESKFQEYAMRDLARELNRGSVVAFVGSGVSAAYGLPTWKRFVSQVVLEHQSEAGGPLEDSDVTKTLSEYIKYLGNFAGPTVGAEKDGSPTAAAADPPHLMTLLEIVSMIREERGQSKISQLISKALHDQKVYDEAVLSKDKPLHYLADVLKIRRYMTTNYDNLIYRYFANKGHPVRSQGEAAAGHGDEQIVAARPDIRSTQQQVFHRWHLDLQRCCDLVFFATQIPPIRAGVYHIHGLALKPDRKSDDRRLIATEREYQELYLKNDLDATFYRESLDLIYAANSILFVGVGMSEEDLNRFLRVSMANMPNRFDRQVFALLPGPRGTNPRTRAAHRFGEAHKMLRRYGVRVIFFGDSDETAAKLGDFARLLEDADDAEARSALEIASSARLTEALVERMRDIQCAWNRWWDSWFWLPWPRQGKFARKSEILAKKPDGWPVAHLIEAGSNANERIVSRHFLARAGPNWASALAESVWFDLLDQIIARTDQSDLPLLLIEGRRGSGRGDLIESLARNDVLVDRLFRALVGSRASPEEAVGGEWHCFLGSTHFSSEFASVADAVTDFLEQIVQGRIETMEEATDTPQSVRSWHTRLEAVIERFQSPESEPRSALIVLSGFQRLVNPQGRFASKDLLDFFSILVRGVRRSESRIRLVLIGREGGWGREAVSRLGLSVPRRDQSIGEDRGERNGNQPRPMHIILRNREFDWNNIDDLSAIPDLSDLSDVSRHHRYSLLLVCVLLKEIPDEHEKNRVVRDLIRDVNRRGRSHQAEIIVDRVVEHRIALLQEGKPAGSNVARRIRAVLGILAVCPSPVDKATLGYLFVREVSFEEGRLDDPDALKEDFEEILENLVDALIVYRFYPRRRHSELKEDSGEDFFRYSVHSALRQRTKVRMGHQSIPFADPGYFELSAPESNGVGLPALEADAARYVYRHVDWLLAGVTDPYFADELKSTDKEELARELANNETRLRYCAHLLRSNLPLVQVLRLEGIPPEPTMLGDVTARLDRHRNRIVGLLNGVRITSGLPHREFDHLTRTHVNGRAQKPIERGVLYLEELMWLYNELAMICRWQGDLIDARSILVQIEGLRSRGQGVCTSEAWCHVYIQSAAVELEMGNIVGAIERLRRVLVDLDESDSILKWRAKAYLALADHIRGEFELAEKSYRKVLKYCRENGRLRSLSIFYRHLGDLQRRRGENEDAEKCYEDALAAATTHPDLFHYARIAQAGFAMRSGKSDASVAASYLNASLSYARETGMPKMEAEVAAVRARIRLSQGELDGAAASARETIAICSRRGLRLRELSGLILLGKVQAERGDRANAKRLLDEVYRRARSMLYVIMAKEAHSALISID